jgi:predicted double-glycine peptidase
MFPMYVISMVIGNPCCPAYERGETPDQDAIILIAVPEVNQRTQYSCGAASLQAVLKYWGFCVEDRDLMDQLHTVPNRGTDPEDIVVLASSYGLDASLSQNITIDELKESIQSKKPVIIVAQAWNGYEEDGTWVKVKPDRWEDVWNDGHYMVVIGIDSRNIYFEDPSLLGTRGVIPIDEFLTRWHYCLDGASE